MPEMKWLSEMMDSGRGVLEHAMSSANQLKNRVNLDVPDMKGLLSYLPERKERVGTFLDLCYNVL